MKTLSVGLSLALIATAALAHSWYEHECCSGQDCAPVPAGVVTVTPRGVHVRVEPGQHPLAMVLTEEFLALDDSRVRLSRDGEDHVCLSPGWYDAEIAPGPSMILCVYIAAMM